MGKKLSNGFTLIELIIVISLIVFLAIMAISYFRNQIFKAQDAKRKSDLKVIQVAVEEYEKDHNCYPTPEMMDCTPGTGLRPYLDKIPCDPITNESYYYNYEVDDCPSWYRLYTVLENKADDDIVDNCGVNNTFNYYTESPNAPLCNLEEVDGFYGCKSGQCVPILWDTNRPGPECDPNFQTPTCYGQCGNPAAQCTTWGSGN